jgi:hypothetical protein
MRFSFFIVFAFVLLCLNVDNSKISLVNKAYAAEDKEKAAPESDYDYLEMSPLLIPVINSRGLSQQVNLIVSLEVEKGMLEEVELYTPRLTDAYIQDLYGVLGAGYGLVNGNVLNVNAIKNRLTKVTYKIVGEENVRDVLLQVVQQRPL